MSLCVGCFVVRVRIVGSEFFVFYSSKQYRQILDAAGTYGYSPSIALSEQKQSSNLAAVFGLLRNFLFLVLVFVYTGDRYLPDYPFS